MDGFEAVVGEPMGEAEGRVRAALGAEGFGVLAEIDISATLGAKLGVRRPGLRILAACNPELANRALEIDPSVSLVLPCNVAIEEHPEGTRVAAVDPTSLFGSEALRPVAEEAAERLRRVVARLGGEGGDE
ncbi:MAG: DUF302 domain-containing protein [Actinomycetota bacterium]|nr:DUF302 domain-containing protein [Actinomycetota bacterium]